MARGNLRLAPLVDVCAGAETGCDAGFGPRGLQRGETRAVHRFERQLRLKPRFGCRVEVARGVQRAFPLELGPVALETERPRRRQLTAVQRLAARWTQGFRAFTFELSARKAHPLIRRRLQVLPECAARH